MMNRRLLYPVLFFLAAVVLTGCKQISSNDAAEQLAAAYRQKDFYPELSETYRGITRAKAYGIQKLFVEKLQDQHKLAGFKAGLTSTASQKRFGAEEPVSAVLFDYGWKESGVVLDRADFHQPMLELEFGYVFDKPIRQKLKDPKEVVNYLWGAVAAVEVPDLGFRYNAISLSDLIASNVGSSHYILGEVKGIKKVNINELSVSLKRNGKVVSQGSGRDVMGNQYEALYWLINQAINQGYNIEEGQVLLTGAMGQMLPMEAGRYEADFSVLGKLTFEVR